MDYGDSRIGLAVCDEWEMLASPLRLVKAASMRVNVDEVARIAIEERAERVVVGLPLNMDGSEGVRASKSRAFARAVEKVSGIKTVCFDERLTSVAAEEIMENNLVKRSRRKDKVDLIAATLILEGYMDYKKKNKE